MMMKRLPTWLLAIAITLAIFTACSSRNLDFGAISPDAGPGSFGTSDASAEAQTYDPGACPTNECPAGRTTCPNNPYPCAVDLTKDDENCGECGVRCGALGAINEVTHCSHGKCQPECTSGGLTSNFRDCNGLSDDGCEIDTSSDPNNCGGCGILCLPPAACILGGCSNIIPPPPACMCGPQPAGLVPFPPSWNADYGCVGGKCFQPTCDDGWADCNNNFTGDPTDSKSDGCEVRVGGTDTSNCGGCGIACKVGETCNNGMCECRCGNACFDISSDIQNCGGCGIICPSVQLDVLAAGGNAYCSNGICGFRCAPEREDCNGYADDGCEVDIADDPLNCGGCGIRCDGIEGQACIDGHCNTKECGTK